MPRSMASTLTKYGFRKEDIPCLRNRATWIKVDELDEILVSFAPVESDDPRILLVSKKNNFGVILCASGRCVGVLQQATRNHAWHPHGTQIAAVLTDQNAVGIFDVNDCSVETIVRAPGISRDTQLQWSPDGRFFALVGALFLSVCNAENWTATMTLNTHRHARTSFTHDNLVCVTQLETGTHIYDPATGQPFAGTHSGATKVHKKAADEWSPADVCPDIRPLLAAFDRVHKAPKDQFSPAENDNLIFSVGHTHCIMLCRHRTTLPIQFICILPLVEYSDRTHYLFSKTLRKEVFTLMCLRERFLRLAESGAQHSVPVIPLTMWLTIFDYLSLF